MTAASRIVEAGMARAEPAGVGVSRAGAVSGVTDAEWQLLGWIGLAMLVAAVGTILTVWVPARFGNVDWEFGTVADSFAALPMLAVGLGACLASAVARQRRAAMLALGIGFVLLVVWLLLAGVLFSTTAVMAWQRAEAASGPLAIGVKRVIARTVWFGMIGGIGCSLAALYSFKTYVATPRRNRA